jgi:SAM-dependent methyltransferase
VKAVQQRQNKPVPEYYWGEVDSQGPLYMDRRIQKDGLVWGEGPSPGAEKVLPFFKEAGAKNILDVGCGYGRDAVFFAMHGFDVTGVDYSIEACKAARWRYQATIRRTTQDGSQMPSPPRLGEVEVLQADFRQWEPEQPKQFDASFAFKTFHQFRHDTPSARNHPLAARGILDRIVRFVRPGGLIAISTFSTEDHNHPKPNQQDYTGRCIEANTYEVRPNRPVAFHTEDSVRNLLSGLEMLKLAHISFEEDHEPDGKHTHSMWLAVARTSHL